jgi:hypothetical protein
MHIRLTALVISDISNSLAGFPNRIILSCLFDTCQFLSDSGEYR